MSQSNGSPTHLPAIAPDLILVYRNHGEWQIHSVSERVALWLKIDSIHARNRAPAALFPQAVPSLRNLATEVLEQGRDLIGVKIRLLPNHPEFLADIQFAGLTDDYLGQLIRINLRRETIASRQQTSFCGLLGSSPAMQEVFRKIKIYAASDAAVIITGETGTGKELVAKALHTESPRSDHPFAALNCAAISEQLLESELFGHERGAFTGAVREHRGYFERANAGTLFLDELGEMPTHTQSKLLRVLEDGMVQRVGGEKSHHVDVRFIGATNVALEQAVANNNFRADLYHRLAVLRIHLPALRERIEDIPLLANLFLQQFNQRYGKQIKLLTSEALRLLQAYLWPGNVRELRNTIERVVIEAETEAIGARAFTEWIHERQQFAQNTNFVPAGAQQTNLPVALPYSQPLDDPAADYPLSVSVRGKRIELSPQQIRRAFHETNGNLAAAARLLGIHRATLYRHMQRLKLSRGNLAEPISTF